MPTAAFDLTDRVALVTGSTRGIGLATAELLAELGAKVIVSSENDSDAASAAQKIGAIPLSCDMAHPADVERAAQRVEAAYGGLDILVLNAGIAGQPGPTSTLDMASYETVMKVNLEGPVRLSSRLVPGMAARGGGAVVFLSSIAGLRGNGAINAYALSKAAIAQLARNLAVEWGPMNVRVNAVSPGLIRTPLSEPLMADGDFMARRMGMTPLRRAGEPAEVAGAIAFLVSPAGAFVTGHNLVVDGGTLITDGS